MACWDYIRLIRFKYHVTFLAVILGAIAFSDGLSLLLAKSLLMLYIAFNVLLYGGLYTINDIADMESDAKNSIKKHRPLPSKKVSPESAWIFATAFIIAGLAAAYIFFGMAFVYIFSIFIGCNLAFTFIAKKIPYLDILFNSLTHPLRLMMGIFLVVSDIPFMLVLAYLAFSIGFASMFFLMEKDIKGWESRKTLMKYTRKNLLAIQVACFAAIAFFAIADFPKYTLWYLLMAVVFSFCVFGSHLSPDIKVLIRTHRMKR
ncbi:UbiA family prenyltransferase [Candidatus Woesearchaeota archaeon]|nr:UbiA family prenyltransferase [Candidatus Woesearchaeota archaeon]